MSPRPGLALRYWRGLPLRVERVVFAAARQHGRQLDDRTLLRVRVR